VQGGVRSGSGEVGGKFAGLYGAKWGVEVGTREQERARSS